jgi:hypothetical protein
MQILSFLEQSNIKFKRIGQNYVCRCPICKDDNALYKHNALINLNFNNIFCFSEGKVYFTSDIRSAIKKRGVLSL